MGKQRTPETHFHTSQIRDSIRAQRRKNRVNDDEKHEENPHFTLEDFLVPKRSGTSSLSLNPGTDDTVANKPLPSDEDVLEPTGTKEFEKGQEGGASKKRPTLARPKRDSLYMADCPKRKSCASVEKRRHIGFDCIVVRDYGMVLGDHPDCSYGPPVTLGWDYMEYEPLSVDEYEIHHSRRRPLREMGLNYYVRKDMLISKAGHTAEELKTATKEANRTKFKRMITRKLLMFRMIEDAMESAGRKMKRLLKKKSSDDNFMYDFGDKKVVGEKEESSEEDISHKSHQTASTTVTTS